MVRQCILSDRRSQQALFDQYKDAMYTVCYRIMKDPDLAMDVVQDSFIKVFKELKSFQFKSTLGTWIKTIVVRTAIHQLKKETILEPLEQVQDIQAVPASELTGHDLEKVILSLPTGYRTVFLLIEVEGYTHKEVAEMLGISEGTSKSQLNNAKQVLKSKLKNSYPEYGT